VACRLFVTRPVDVSDRNRIRIIRVIVIDFAAQRDISITNG